MFGVNIWVIFIPQLGSELESGLVLVVDIRVVHPHKGYAVFRVRMSSDSCHDGIKVLRLGLGLGLGLGCPCHDGIKVLRVGLHRMTMLVIWLVVDLKIRSEVRAEGRC